MEQVVTCLTYKVPSPKKVMIGDTYQYRYTEKTIHQAIVQKLARMVSTLNGTRLLLENGFLQEHASLQRIINEIAIDIAFLVFGILQDDHNSDRHVDYLKYFYQEEFDAETALESSQKRPTISRRKIQAYVTNSPYWTDDPSTAQEIFRTLSKASSGFVHAASPHVMEMYRGDTKRFHMRGLKGRFEYESFELEHLQYLHIGIFACTISAKVFDCEDLFEECRKTEKALIGLISKCSNDANS